MLKNYIRDRSAIPLDAYGFLAREEPGCGYGAGGISICGGEDMLDVKYSTVDLFAGPGGLSLGFQMTSRFEIVCAVECDDTVAETYERNHKGVKVIRKRISEVDPHDLLRVAREKGFERIDVIVGGPPCRPFTRVNHGKTRWDKAMPHHSAMPPDFEDLLRMVDVLKPKAVVLENVPGLRNAQDGEVLAKLVRRTEALGYTCAVGELDAAHYGVPQRRRRIFVVCTWGRVPNIELLPEIPEDPRFVTVGDAISDLPLMPDGKTKTSYATEPVTTYQQWARQRSTVLTGHVYHVTNPSMKRRFRYIPQGANLRRVWSERRIPVSVMKGDLATTRWAVRGFSRKTLNNMHSNIYRRLEWNKPAFTITHVRKTVIIHPTQDRLISVREAARLQSFPDWFEFSGSLSQQYQQIADAVPPLMARAVATHVALILDAMLQNYAASAKSIRRTDA